MLFCPSCEQEARIFIAPIFDVMHQHTSISNVVACTDCAFISELSNQGMLVDAGCLLVSDLEEPTLESAPMTMFAAGSQLRRSES